MRLLVLNGDYGAFMRRLYAAHPGLDRAPFSADAGFARQYAELRQDCRGGSKMGGILSHSLTPR